MRLEYLSGLNGKFHCKDWRWTRSTRSSTTFRDMLSSSPFHFHILSSLKSSQDHSICSVSQFNAECCKADSLLLNHIDNTLFTCVLYISIYQSDLLKIMQPLPDQRLILDKLYTTLLLTSTAIVCQGSIDGFQPINFIYINIRLWNSTFESPPT